MTSYINNDLILNVILLDDEKYDQNSKDNIIRENWNEFIPNINAQSIFLYKGVSIRICTL